MEPRLVPSPSLLPLILFYVTFDPLPESKVTRKCNQQKEGETGNEVSGAWCLLGREYICMAEVISTVHLNSLAVFITMSLSIHHQQLYYLPKCCCFFGQYTYKSIIGICVGHNRENSGSAA